MVMRKLNEDGIKKRMFNHIKRLMRKEERKKESIKVLNAIGNILTVVLGVRKEMNRNGMTSRGQMFSLQEMRFTLKGMKENKATDESGVIAEYLKSLEIEDVKKLRILMNGTDIEKNGKRVGCCTRVE